MPSASFPEIVGEVGEGPCENVVHSLEPTIPERRRASRSEHLVLARTKGLLDLCEGHLAILYPCEGEAVALRGLHVSKALRGAPNKD